MRLPGRFHHGPGRRRGAGGGVPDRLRPARCAPRPRDRSGSAGARVDLHRRGVSAHVCVVDVLPDPDRGDRRLRGGVGVLRRRVQGVDPRQPQGRGHRGRCGQPAAVAGLVGLRPACRVRHRPGPGPLPAGQAAGGTGGAVRPRQLLGRGVLHRPGRRPGPGRDVVPGAGRDAGPRHHREAAGRAVRRAGGGVSAAGAAALRPADLHPGEGAPRLPRRGRPGVVLGAGASDRLTPGRPRRLASWSSSTPPGRGWPVGEDPSAAAARWPVHRP